MTYTTQQTAGVVRLILLSFFAKALTGTLRCSICSKGMLVRSISAAAVMHCISCGLTSSWKGLRFAATRVCRSLSSSWAIALVLTGFDGSQVGQSYDLTQVLNQTCVRSLYEATKCLHGPSEQHSSAIFVDLLELLISTECYETLTPVTLQ